MVPDARSAGTASSHTAVIRYCRDLLAGVGAATAAALLLVPAGRPVAWLALVATAALVGRVLGHDVGTAGGMSAGLAYMWAHGSPRFATTIDDPWTIRFGWLLMAAGGPGRARRFRRPASPPKQGPPVPPAGKRPSRAGYSTWLLTA